MSGKTRLVEAALKAIIPVPGSTLMQLGDDGPESPYSAVQDDQEIVLPETDDSPWVDEDFFIVEK